MRKPSTPFLGATLLLSSLLALHFFSPSSPSLPPPPHFSPHPSPLKIYVAPLPKSVNFGLLEKYWSLNSPDSRIGFDPDLDLRVKIKDEKFDPLPYPESPLIKQYSAEYWLLRDLEAPSSVERVVRVEDADVIFVPFFATLSAEIELGWGKKGGFGKKEGNEDYARQREVVDFITSSDAWKRSGGRDHVFVLTDPVAMWHVRGEIAPAILLVVDFGGWFKLDEKSSSGAHPNVIQHYQVSLLKDVIVPYTHLLPKLHLSDDGPRHTLLYFKGAKHRHRGGLVREKLWDVLVHEEGVVMEEGFPNSTGREQSIKGMRSSEFCLHPAGILDYSEFSILVSEVNALQPHWLVDYLGKFSSERRQQLRQNMARIQPVFEYERNGGAGSGAVDYVWRKVSEKVPIIRQEVVRNRRKPLGTEIPLRCHCT